MPQGSEPTAHRTTWAIGDRSGATHARADMVGRMTVTRWEYATVPLLVHATKQILDTWGQDGWELAEGGGFLVALRIRLGNRRRQHGLEDRIVLEQRIGRAGFCIWQRQNHVQDSDDPNKVPHLYLCLPRL